MISIKGLRAGYGDKVVIDGLDLDIYSNAVTCILGPSGSGKTTLLNVLSGRTGHSGEISGLTGDVSAVFQESRLIPGMSAAGNIEFVLRSKIADRRERERIVAHYLGLVGLSGYGGYYPHELSGGMAQRVAIARAFAFPSRLLLLDEPFKALDLRTKGTVIDAFLSVWENDRRTAVCVTHDPDEAALLADFVYVFTADFKFAGQFSVPIKKAGRFLSDPQILEIRNNIVRLLLS